MFELIGNEEQLKDQKYLLVSRGIVVEYNRNNPTINTFQIDKALGLIYENKVSGWWHYRQWYKLFGICTSTEFGKSLLIH